MIRYKLVDRNFCTRAGEKNETVWQLPDGSHPKIKASGAGHTLCTDGVIHSYTSPLLGVMMNSAHADIKDPIGIEVECGPLVADDGTKGGHKWAQMVREVPLPQPTLRQRVIFAILCVLAIPGRELIAAWEKWAYQYLAGSTTRAAAAHAAAHTAHAAAHTAHAAAHTAHAAANAANAAHAAHGAVHAAHAAANATNAVHAVHGAAAPALIDFAALAQKAMEA